VSSSGAPRAVSRPGNGAAGAEPARPGAAHRPRHPGTGGDLLPGAGAAGRAIVAARPDPGAALHALEPRPAGARRARPGRAGPRLPPLAGPAQPAHRGPAAAGACGDAARAGRFRGRESQPGTRARIRRRLLRRARRGERGPPPRLLESARGDAGRGGAPGDTPATEDGRVGDGTRRGRPHQRRAQPRVRDGADLPRAGVLRGGAGLAARGRGPGRHRGAAGRRTAEGLPARGAGGARPLSPAARQRDRSARSAAGARLGQLPRPVPGHAARRRGGGPVGPAVWRRGPDHANWVRPRHPPPSPPTGGPRGAPPLFSLTRSVNRIAEEIPGTWFTPLLSTGPDSWATTDMSVLRTGSSAFVSGRDRRGPVTVGAEVEFTVPVPAGGDVRTGRLVVYGNAEFANNFFIEYLGNKDLFVNTVAWLARDPAVLEHRSARQEPGRNQFFLTAAQGDLVFWAAAIVEPLLFAVVGIGLV